MLAYRRSSNNFRFQSVGIIFIWVFIEHTSYTLSARFVIDANDRNVGRLSIPNSKRNKLWCRVYRFIFDIADNVIFVYIRRRIFNKVSTTISLSQPSFRNFTNRS